MKQIIALVFAICSTSVYGQLGQAAGAYAQAQQKDEERKHQLQMQREAEQTALEIARIQAQSRAAQAAQPQVFLWESGNAFLQVCASSFDKADALAAQTDTEIVNGVACMSFLRGLDEGVSFGVQFADVSTKQQSPSPWCTPDNATAVPHFGEIHQIPPRDFQSKDLPPCVVCISGRLSLSSETGNALDQLVPRVSSDFQHKREGASSKRRYGY